MILPTLQLKIAESMKAGDKTRVETLRMLSSNFNYAKIAKQHELSEEDELSVIRKEVKQRKESIEAYEKANRPDLVIPEKAQLDILSEFLPPEMSDEEVIQLVSDSIIQINAKTMADMGKVIGLVKSKAPSADGAKIADLVKQKLNG
jgi:uncharacterized protein YqeY